MTELEMHNQQVGLRDAIIRLCNEADTDGIALASIIMAYAKFAESMGMSPDGALHVFANSIFILAGRK